MNFDWIFWRAAVPIIGPFSLFFVYFLLQTATRSSGISLTETLSKGFDPTRLIFFSFSSFAYTYFTLEGLDLNPKPWQTSWSLFMLVVCLLFHYDIVVQRQVQNALIPAKTARIGFFIAISASVISYMSQDAFL